MARASTCPRTRGSIHAAPACTYCGCAVRRCTRSYPASAVTEAKSSSAGQGRSGFTWSGVSGETPPQSSTPAPINAKHSLRDTRFGGACTRIFGPSTSRVTAIVARKSSMSASGADFMAVSDFARKFCTITSWTWPNSLCTLRIA
ncbi:Uncharacterised protein [Mycobacteroides abscessus subsp. abscessus]|nr:Uncharacterised protein [Mycobacteroides abscessus subsp. abscessus]